MPGNELLDIQIGVERTSPEIGIAVDRTWKEVGFEINKGGPEYPDYTGPYVVKSTFYFQQVLETYGRHMTDNVIVDSIKVVETSNPQGGKTIVIG